MITETMRDFKKYYEDPKENPETALEGAAGKPARRPKTKRIKKTSSKPPVNEE
jgi:hypothetical protein